VSSTTWTLIEVASNTSGLECHIWRATDAQHVVSTVPLVDTREEQLELERLLEHSKPPIPDNARGLHYLLFTPFRYPSPQGSRFRASTDPGVYYGADAVRTACAELGYWRWHVLSDSPDLDFIEPKIQSVFRASVACGAVDLRSSPFDRDMHSWMHPKDYAACQTFGRTAREANVAAIAYQSVRDPEGGMCVAVLSSAAFAPDEIVPQSWWLTVTREKVFWHRDSPISSDAFEFDMTRWASS
jgi:hypothetical protein